MKVIYSRYGDLRLAPYVQFLYAKAKFPNTKLFVYNDDMKKVNSEKEISNADYIWISFKDFGETLPSTWDDNDMLDYEFCTKVRHDPLLIKTIEDYGIENCGDEPNVVLIAEINEPYVIMENEIGEYVMTMSSVKWQGTELLNN